MKHAINEAFFDEWTEISAYVLGYWWADGNLYIKHRPSGARRYARFSIVSIDKDHLQSIGQLMGWGGTVRPKMGQDGRIIYVIDISNNKIADRLLDLGVREHKSSAPNFPVVPAKYLSHFIRGLYDGDGGICYKHFKSRHDKELQNLTTYFSAGNEEFLQTLVSTLRRECGTGNKHVVQNSKNGWKIHFGQYDSMLLCEWMYKNATFAMQRKKKIWDDADKEKLLNSKKYFGSNKV